jgi:hypothetical protein
MGARLVPVASLAILRARGMDGASRNHKSTITTNV